MIDLFFLLPDQEDSGPLNKPHLPLTAMKKSSCEAPAVPHSPASVPRATKETPAQSVETPAQSGEQKIELCLVNQCASSLMRNPLFL